MPPAPSRNFFIILFDLKIEKLYDALHSLANILLYKRLMKVKDIKKLYVVNTQTNTNIEGMRFIDASLEIDAIVSSISSFQQGQSDFLEVLEAGLNELQEQFEKPGIVTLQLIFITDLKSFKSPKNEKLEKSIIKLLNNYNIFLYIIGPDVSPSKTIFSKSDIKKWMNSLEFDGNGDNLNTVKKIAKESHHMVICNLDLGEHLFNSVKYSKRKQPWLVPLSFGTHLSLPFATIKVTLHNSTFKLKSKKSRMDRAWVYQDQEDVEVNYNDIVKGLIRHGKFVNYYGGDKRFKNDESRCFSVIGFVDAENIPEYLLRSEESHVVVPNNRPEQAQYLTLFWSLIEEMINLKKYIVAKKLYYANVNRKYVVLIPSLNENKKGLIVSSLPYAQDVAFPYKEDSLNLPETQISAETSTFLDSLDVNSDTCKLNIPLTPVMMVKPSCMNIMNKIQEKLIDGKKIAVPCNPIKLENFASSWPCRERTETKGHPGFDNAFDDIEDFDFS